MKEKGERGNRDRALGKRRKVGGFGQKAPSSSSRSRTGEGQGPSDGRSVEGGAGGPAHGGGGELA
jgi:hypothetical protein